MGKASKHLAFQPPSPSAMKRPKKKSSSKTQARERDRDSVYTIQVICEIAGVPRRTIISYQEHGLIAPVATAGAGAQRFNDEALRALRRIEHLRIRYEMNLRTLKFTLGLLDELERLQNDVRARR
jgi:MerR HTH family regulatory protein